MMEQLFSETRGICGGKRYLPRQSQRDSSRDSFRWQQNLMTNTLFSIQLRVGQDILDLQIEEGDTIRSLIHKMAKGRVEIKGPKMEEKIVNSLVRIAEEKATESSLRLKINKFLKRNVLCRSKNQDNKTCGKSQLKAPDKENMKEPCNPTEAKNKLSQINEECSFICHDSPKQVTIQEVEQDDELIQAYRVVLAKCKNIELRNLVTKTLNQLNLKQERKHKNSLEGVTSTHERTGRVPAHQLVNKYLYNPNPKGPNLYLLNAPPTHYPSSNLGNPLDYPQLRSTMRTQAAQPDPTPAPRANLSGSKSGNQSRKYNYLKDQE